MADRDPRVRRRRGARQLRQHRADRRAHHDPLSLTPTANGNAFRDDAMSSRFRLRTGFSPSQAAYPLSAASRTAADSASRTAPPWLRWWRISGRRPSMSPPPLVVPAAWVFRQADHFLDVGASSPARSLACCTWLVPFRLVVEPAPGEVCGFPGCGRRTPAVTVGRGDAWQTSFFPTRGATRSSSSG